MALKFRKLRLRTPTIRVNPSSGPPGPLAISGTPGAAIVGTAYSFSPGVVGGSGPKTYALTGTLPAGLMFSASNGSITGTPTTAGTTSGITVTVTDTSGSAPLLGLSIAVAASVTLAALTVSSGSGTVGTAYTGTISGQTSGSTLSLTGAGAAGLSISGTAISGTPTAAGSVDVVETLAGATNTPRTTSGLVTVAAAGASVTLAALSVNNATATVGTPYTGTISGKTAGSTLSLTGSGSAGLSVSGVTMSGTPTAEGLVSIVETLAGATNSPRTTAQFLTSAAPVATTIKGVVFEVDSITYGTGSSDPATKSYPAQFAALTGLPITNQGVFGDTLANADSQYAQNDAPLYNATNKNTIVILGGINDLAGAVANSTDLTVRANLQSICSKARATGFIVAVGTLLPRTDSQWNQTMEGYRVAHNNWIRANYQSLGAYLIDFANIPEAQDPNNTTYYGDKLHPNDPLYAKMAALVQSSLSVAALPAPTTYTLTGPSTATVGTASANFAVAVSGTLTSAVTVTPSDGGAGGTFTPATVTLTTAANAQAAFTYTAASAGAKTVSVTNNGGLTNPSPLTVTASASAGTTDQFLRLNILSNSLTESVDGSGYSYAATNPGSFFNNNYGASTKSIPAGADGYAGAISVDPSSATSLILGLAKNGTPSGFGDWDTGVYVESGVYKFLNGTAGATVTAAANDIVRLDIVRSSSTVSAKVSKDGGTTYTVIRTWPSITGALWLKAGTASSTSPVKKPFGSANMA